MPKLFLDDITTNLNQKVSNYNFGCSYAYDFETGEFIKDELGRIKKLSIYESYIQWCKKALSTKRNCYEAYSKNFGIDDIDPAYDVEAMKIEIKKKVTDCLSAHPYTSMLSNWKFEVKKTKIYYSFELYSKFGTEIINDYIDTIMR